MSLSIKVGGGNSGEHPNVNIPTWIAYPAVAPINWNNDPIPQRCKIFLKISSMDDVFFQMSHFAAHVRFPHRSSNQWWSFRTSFDEVPHNPPFIQGSLVTNKPIHSLIATKQPWSIIYLLTGTHFHCYVNITKRYIWKINNPNQNLGSLVQVLSLNRYIWYSWFGIQNHLSSIWRTFRKLILFTISSRCSGLGKI